ncbi:M48 family metalloprotease [Sphaerotilus mobilis]|uniref:Peptidase M48-like protein n=1 Tax=Sphaerotilus mobilis TaxID=47994 RepID=A0A4Q7LIR9_9BURK|nr:M48 family metalloprotease [Sphaerotilus mobilis]RZS53309.1 peptidase M48-like protein [Sphaerotilus mobilis]
MPHVIPADRTSRWRLTVQGLLALWLSLLSLTPVAADPAAGATTGDRPPIREVLDRSAQQRLAELSRHRVDAHLSAGIQADVDRILGQMAVKPAIDLLVVDGPFHAEILGGHVLVVSASVAVLPEGERLFILAHEIGHAAMGHWGELCELYGRLIPGEVRQDLTDAIAPQLGREASALVHGHEYAADAHAWQILRSLGHGMDSVLAALQVVPNLGDTPTHPSTRKRYARLRLVGENEPRSAALKTAE